MTVVRWRHIDHRRRVGARVRSHRDSGRRGPANTRIDGEHLARGVRMASDFLMGLQGQGAYRKNSLTNVQVELPAVVIGGGLTAIDTATELQAYYVTQVEKALERFERLKRRIDEGAIWAKLDEEETRTLRTWLDHGRMVHAERAAAAAAGRPPDFARLVRSWGGVTIAYRKRLQDSPAYRLNHEEVIKSLEEGIGFVECMSPIASLLDEHDHVRALECTRMSLVEGKWIAQARRSSFQLARLWSLPGLIRTRFTKGSIGEHSGNRQRNRVLVCIAPRTGGRSHTGKVKPGDTGSSPLIIRVAVSSPSTATIIRFLLATL